MRPTNGRLLGVMDVIDAIGKWVSWISCVMDVMDVIPPRWARMDISVFESKPDDGLILRDTNDKSTNHPTDNTKTSVTPVLQTSVRELKAETGRHGLAASAMHQCIHQWRNRSTVQTPDLARRRSRLEWMAVFRYCKATGLTGAFFQFVRCSLAPTR